MEELKSCLCGAKASLEKGQYYFSKIGQFLVAYKPFCSNFVCGRTGNAKVDKDATIQTWNQQK